MSVEVLWLLDMVLSMHLSKLNTFVFIKAYIVICHMYDVIGVQHLQRNYKSGRHLVVTCVTAAWVTVC